MTTTADDLHDQIMQLPRIDIWTQEEEERADWREQSPPRMQRADWLEALGLPDTPVDEWLRGIALKYPDLIDIVSALRYGYKELDRHHEMIIRLSNIAGQLVEIEKQS